MPRTGSQLSVYLALAAGLVCLAAHPAFPQAPPQPAPNEAPATVQSVLLVHYNNYPAIEILSSRPVAPSIQTLTNPPRLVIDLPNANMALKRKRIAVQGDQITAIRVDQYQASPPITRVVVDLLAARGYSWDSAGNRLMVRLKPAEDPNAASHASSEPPAVPTLSTGVKPAVVPVMPGGGNVIFAGSRISTGSSVTAGADTAILHIARGGEVRVCPGSTVSVTTSPNGQDLMLGMSTGALEAHYQLGPSADSILTPDFRILLAGPGDFHYAVSSNSHGDTCVRALMGNSASAIVSELMGDRTYQVKPTEQVVFHAGRIDKVGNDVPLECGCPPPAQPVMRASAENPLPVADANPPAHLQMPDGASPPPPPPSGAAMASASVGAPTSGSETAPLPPSSPNEVHVQVEAPFVFRATDPRPGPAAAPVAQAQAITLYPRDLRFDIPALPPPVPIELAQTMPPSPPPAPKQHRSMFGHIKGFFAAIFR